MTLLTLSTALAAALSAMVLGGGVYEVRVVDPAWPGNPILIQPRHGGLDRKRFWIAAHSAFEASLILALALAWAVPGVRAALLVALAGHGLMRLWSALDFIPRALAFERAEPWSVPGSDALRWVRRSPARLPLSLLATVACLVALVRSAAP
jgi:hypothetical protein